MRIVCVWGKGFSFFLLSLFNRFYLKKLYRDKSDEEKESSVNASMASENIPPLSTVTDADALSSRGRSLSCLTTTPRSWVSPWGFSYRYGPSVSPKYPSLFLSLGWIGTGVLDPVPPRRCRGVHLRRSCFRCCSRR